MAYKDILISMDLRAVYIRRVFKTWLNDADYWTISAIGKDEIYAQFKEDSDEYVIIKDCLNKTDAEVITELKNEIDFRKLMGID